MFKAGNFDSRKYNAQAEPQKLHTSVLKSINTLMRRWILRVFELSHTRHIVMSRKLLTTHSGGDKIVSIKNVIINNLPQRRKKATMSKWLVSAVLSLGLVLSFTITPASAENWKELLNRADSLSKAQNQDSAIVVGELALEKAIRQFGQMDTNTAQVFSKLGFYNYVKANFSEAESLTRRALNIKEKLLGDEHPDVANSLNNLGIIYLQQGKYSETEPLYQRALTIREKALGSEHPAVATSLHNLAVLYKDQGMYSEAESLYQRALAMKEKTLGVDHPDVVTILNQLADLYREQGKYAEAEPLFRKALDIGEKTLGPDHPEVATSLHNWAALYRAQGRYSEAEPLYKRAIDILEKTFGPDHPKLAVALNNLGAMNAEQGKTAEAEPLVKRALGISEKALGAEHPYVARSLNTLASIYWSRAEYQKAEPLFERALDIWEKTLGPNHPQVAQGFHNLASLYRNQHKYGEAEVLYKRAWEIFEKVLGPDHPDLAVTLGDLALLYSEQGRYIEAELLHKRALTIREKALGPDHPDLATSLNNLGLHYYYQGRYMEAKPLYKRALAIREKTLGSEHPLVSETLERLAAVCASLGEVDQSLVHYKKLERSRENFTIYVFSYAAEEQKMKYIDEYPLVDQSLLSFAIMNNADNSKSSALEMILKGKAVVIDYISAEKEIVYCSHNDEIQKKAERHAETCGEISTLTLAGAEKLDPEIYRDRLQALYNKKDSLESELSKNCTEFKDELAIRRFTVADVSNALPQGSILWEFVRYEPYDFKKVGNDKERTGPPRYIAFTLDHAGNITLTDLGDAGEIDSLVNLARKRIYQAREEVYSPMAVESEKRLNEVTGKLYDLIFAPLESHLSNNTDIFISPDGQLSLLPFEILPCLDGKYVIEKFKISYLSSGRDLLKFKMKPESGNWALVMADPDFDRSEVKLAQVGGMASNKPNLAPYIPEPLRGASGCLNNRFNSLPYTREETKSIIKTLKDKANLTTQVSYSGDASEEVLKGMATPPKILHLATHGYFCEDVDLTKNKMLENPLLRSGLALAGANRLMDENQKSDSLTEDGILTAFEASGLNLIGTELVTLSACETGVGEVKNGEGVFGLRRAIQHAGARTIVMSLWRVPDQETCELMRGFYQNWLSGQTKQEALRQSTLKVLNACRSKYGTAHPLLWGGFVMVGDPN